uniref:DUF3402 domain-containing protein n=1 Tax=Heterorhabditis bacteriophora TaxID=37862 RepID=A0A1I7WWU0_HETBA
MDSREVDFGSRPLPPLPPSAFAATLITIEEADLDSGRTLSFGKRNGLNYRRAQDCILLQESEMIVVSCIFLLFLFYTLSFLVYLDHIRSTFLLTYHLHQIFRWLLRTIEAKYVKIFCILKLVFLNGLSADEDTLVRVKHRREKSNSMGSVANGYCEEVGTEAGDSEEEDDDGSCPSHESFVDLKDSVRECLEKEPSERNSEDLAVLLVSNIKRIYFLVILTLFFFYCNSFHGGLFFQDFMQHMSAFASLPMSIKRQLCLKMVFAVVNDAGTVVMHHNEKLDAW